MKLKLEIDLPDDALVIDVRSFLAAMRFVLRGIFPTASFKNVMEKPRPKVVSDPASKVLLN
jgi:hypothetical protein